MRESKIVRARKDLEAACEIAGWNCENDDSIITYIRQILKFYDKVLTFGDAEFVKMKTSRGAERAAVFNQHIRATVRNKIQWNEYLRSEAEKRDGLEKFSVVAKKYYALVKEGKEIDLTGKKGETANYRMIKELANDILQDSGKITDESYLNIF